MTTITHPLADEYLRRLDHAARPLPRRQREELLAEIRDHLDVGLPPEATEADVRNLLDDLGPPEAIIAAARPDRAPTRRGARELFAILLLLTGFPPVLGWLVGVALLLWSPLWSARQKLLGILVWPGGLIAAVGAATLTGTSTSCPTGAVGPSGVPIGCTTGSGAPAWGLAVAVVLVVAPLLVAAYLYRAAGRTAEAS